jgi:hypothetical protein
MQRPAEKVKQGFFWSLLRLRCGDLIGPLTAPCRLVERAKSFAAHALGPLAGALDLEPALGQQSSAAMS